MPTKPMDPSTRRFIRRVLDAHHTMTLATSRADGWPQATTVAYAVDGMTLYFACDPDCQKVKNIRRSKKVSLAIDEGDGGDWAKLKGISMGATAEVLKAPADVRRAARILAKRFPAMGDMSEGVAFVKVTPKVVSVIDYAKGFGHTELVRAA